MKSNRLKVYQLVQVVSHARLSHREESLARETIVQVVLSTLPGGSRGG